MSDVEIGSFSFHTELGTLKQRISFCMDCSHTMSVDDKTAFIDAMNITAYRSIVAPGNHSFVSDDRGAHCKSRAGASHG
jgi:hypothetical protein